MMFASLTPRTRRQKYIIILLILFGIFLYRVTPEYIYYGGLRIYKLDPNSYERKVEAFDFQQTATEEKCFSGTIGGRLAGELAPSSIPKTVHFLWGLKPPRANFPRDEFSFAVYLAIRAALVTLKPNEIKLHYSYFNQDNQWFQKIKNNITLVYHDPTSGFLAQFSELRASHLSDVFRLEILETEGGIYLDIDVFVLQSFDTILSGGRDIIMGHEGGDRSGLCNAVIASRKDSKFLKRMINSYSIFDSKTEWNLHSVIIPNNLAAEYPDEICALSPVAFFWPMWTHNHLWFMFDELSPAEALVVEREVAENGGALHRQQLAYHAANHFSYEPYLQHLTPEKIMTKNTRFNILMRRFLE